MKRGPGRPNIGKLRDISRTVKNRAVSATEQAAEGYSNVVDTTTSAANSGIQSASQRVVDTTSSLGDSAGESARRGAEAALSSVEQAKIASDGAWRATTSVADRLLSATQGMLTESLSGDLNDLLQNIAEGSATIAKQKVSEYMAEYEEGGCIRKLEGGLTLAGAIIAARNASPDDTLVQEALETVQNLFGDDSTVLELPFVSRGMDTYELTAETLEARFQIPKDWFYNLDVYENTDLLFGAIDVVSLALNWNSADTEAFARLAGRLGFWASLSGSPSLLIVTVVALAKAFEQARQTGAYAEFVDGQFEGALSAGTTLAAVSLVGVAGGPAGAALLAGMAAGILAQKAGKDVSVVGISRFMAEQATFAAVETKKMAGQYLEVAMEGSYQALAATATESKLSPDMPGEPDPGRA